MEMMSIEEFVKQLRESDVARALLIELFNSSYAKKDNEISENEDKLMTELNAIRAEKDELRDKLSYAREQLVEQEGEISELNYTLNNTTEEMEAYRLRVEKAYKNEEELESELKDLQDKFKAYEKTYHELALTADKYKGDYEKIRDEMTQNKLSMADMHNEINKITNQLHDQEDRCKRKDVMIKLRDSEIQGLRNELESIRAEK